MGSFVVVVIKVVPEVGNQLLDGFVFLEIDIIIFHRAPQAFDHDVVGSPASAVHADGNAVILKRAGVLGAQSVLEISGDPWCL